MRQHLLDDIESEPARGWSTRMFVTDDHEVIFMPVVRRRSFIPSVGARRTITTRQLPFNISARRVGGLTFIKVGRLCVSVCLTSTYRPL
jgi:hypothetical protein